VVERQATAAFPALTEGIVLTHFLVSDDVERSRRFYTDVLGARPCWGANPRSSRSQTAGSSSTSEADQPRTKPAVSLETPRNPDRVSSFLNIRVPDIQSIYEQWHARGAEFLTHRSTAGARSAPTSATPDGHLDRGGPNDR